MLIELHTVHENSLYLCDVVSGLYGDADPAHWAGEAGGGGCCVGRVQVVVVVVPPAPDRPLVGGLVHVQVVVLRRQAVVVHGLVQAVVEVESVLGPGAVTRAVTRAVGGAVGHLAGLQAAVAPHGAVQVQPGDQRLADVDAFAPVDGVVVHAGEGALQAHGEHQVLLLLQERRIQERRLDTRPQANVTNVFCFVLCFFLKKKILNMK